MANDKGFSKAGKKTTGGKNDEFTPYAHLRISKGKRFGLWFVLTLTIPLVSTLVFQNQAAENPWTEVLWPVIGVGCLLMLYPLTERWHYEPWQSSARRYEKSHGRG